MQLLIIYYHILPFLAYIGVGLQEPEMVGAMAMGGWLPMILYYLFMLTKKKQEFSSWPVATFSILTIVMLFVAEMFFLGNNIWDFFAMQMVFEIITLSVGIFLYMMVKLPEAWKDGMTFVMVFSMVVIGGSALMVIWSVLAIQDIPFALTLGTASLLAAFLFDIASETIFFKKVAEGQIVQDDSLFEKNTAIYCLGILFWIMGMPPIIYVMTGYGF